MTETSSIQVASREDIGWWKMFMFTVYENHSSAVNAVKIYCTTAAIPKVDVSIDVYLR